jgi:hypothetical protein
MSDSKSTATATATSGGAGFFGLLTIALVVLKLTGYIQWSWLWITAPLWIPGSFALIVAVLCLGLLAYAEIRQSRIDAAYRRPAAAPAAHEHGPRRRWGRKP